MKSHNEIVDDFRRLNLSQVIYGSYTRMEKMEELAYNTFGNSSIATATDCNVFVDINSIIHALYSEHNRVVYDCITDVSSGIINLCAHYRSFFRKRGVNTRFFLINSLNTCAINRKYVGDYNTEFLMKTQVTNTKKMIDNNMTLLKVLCPYLPQIYYVESPDNYETAVIIAHIIETLHNGLPNLIISHDMYPLQLTALYPYTTYLYPMKRKVSGGSEDTSWMLPINEKPTYRRDFWNAVRTIRRIDGKGLDEISPLNFALYCAMTKFPERGLKSICTTLQAVNFIKSIVGSEDIKVLSAQFMNDDKLVNSFPVANIDSRYKAFDVQYMLPFYASSPEAKAIQFLDLEDVAAVNNIASKYYANNPLELQKL